MATTMQPPADAGSGDAALHGTGDALDELVRLLDDVPLVLLDASGRPARWSSAAEDLPGFEAARSGGVEAWVRALRAGKSARSEGLALPTLDHAPTASFHGLLTRDPRMLEVIDVVRHVAERDVTVLVRGESGTGKELVARAIHQESPRRDGPFVAINCAAFAPTLLESELFGHEKGAFTGAVRRHQGVFERAHGGTLFLDEVGELSPELQARLLRVLEDRSFHRVGGTTPISVDVRIVSATHRSLREEVRAGRFREDLMYRLRVVPIFLPPLRDRRADIPLLLRHFIDALARRGGRTIERIEPRALRALLDHPWPGNVRELINVVEYAYAVGRGPTLAWSHLPPEFRERGETGRRASPWQDLPEPEAIRRALAAHGGRVTDAARALGMNRVTLWRKRKKYGIGIEEA